MAASGWSNYENRFASSDADTVKISGDICDVTEHTENANGVQAELEERWATHGWPGVLTGLAPTEDDVNDEIDIATGVGYVSGLKLTGGVSVALAGYASNTYHLYVDPDEALEADAYKIKTAVPDWDELLLARFAWNGTDTITDFEDLRQRGIESGLIEWSNLTDEALAAYDTKIIRTFIAPAPLCLRRASARVVTCGTADSNIIDIHTGVAGATASIWSAAGDRITIAHDDTDGLVVHGDLADQNFLVARGELVEIHVDDVATDAAGLSVIVPYTYY